MKLRTKVSCTSVQQAIGLCRTATSRKRSSNVRWQAEGRIDLKYLTKFIYNFMSKQNSADKKCGPGKILKKGYNRRAYERSDGTIVAATRVPPTCIKDVGGPGHGPKTLPPISGDIHVTQYGYSVHKPANERRSALDAATKDHGALEVLEHLNLIRNYQPVPKNKAIFSADVKYLQRKYANIRKSRPKDPELLAIWEKSQNRRKKSQHGGADMLTSDTKLTDIGPTSETSPDFPNRAIEMQQTVCTQDGECITKTKLFESHNVDGKNVVFYSLAETDADAILALDKTFIDANQTRENVVKKIQNNRGRLIGIKVNGVLQGYCLYDIAATKTVQIIWFSANKGYGKTLYIFVKRYFKRNDYTRIIVIITLDSPYTLIRLNFWYGVGFTAFEDHITDDKQIYFEKYL